MSDQKVFKTTELFNQVKALAQAKGYNVYSMKWLNSLRAFTLELRRSQKNIENGGWDMIQLTGGPQNRQWKFTKNGKEI